jgi:alpha-ketoglutarate-dependent taurine dioxygenase
MNQSDQTFLSKNLKMVDGLKFKYEFDKKPENTLKWINENAGKIKNTLQTNGALLLKGLNIQGSKKLEKVLNLIFDEELLEYVYRSTPRTKMRGRIYTSSEYHPAETILLHNENAYSNRWPMRIAFYCVKSAKEGGATPISDSRVIYQSIPKEIREEFEQRKLLYVRNYTDIDLHWNEVFQTKDKDAVAQFCRLNNVEFEWFDDDKLRTKQQNTASCRHPITKEMIWFNQAHLFHIFSQSEDVRNSLLNVVGIEGLPRNVYFGDGGVIPDDMIDEINKVYKNNMVIFDWQEGDLMLLDNMLFAHGRQAFKGSRRILTGMSIVMDVQSIQLINKEIEEVL